jgi:phage shock protein C
MSNRRQLRRNTDDKIIAGVASGVAEFFDLDTTVVRVVWAVSVLFGFGIFVYLIMWLVVPEKGQDRSVAEDIVDQISRDEEE